MSNDPQTPLHGPTRGPTNATHGGIVGGVSSESKSRPNSRWILKRADQLTVAVLLGTCLASIATYYLIQTWLGGGLIELDRNHANSLEFQVNINNAEWPELVQLPGIGRELADRIIDYRRENGPYKSTRDLLKVRGIGRRTLDRLEPYLISMPESGEVAGAR